MPLFPCMRFRVPSVYRCVPCGIVSSVVALDGSFGPRALDERLRGEGEELGEDGISFLLFVSFASEMRGQIRGKRTIKGWANEWYGKYDTSRPYSICKRIAYRDEEVV